MILNLVHATHFSASREGQSPGQKRLNRAPHLIQKAQRDMDCQTTTWWNHILNRARWNSFPRRPWTLGCWGHWDAGDIGMLGYRLPDQHAASDEHNRGADVPRVAMQERHGHPRWPSLRPSLDPAPIEFHEKKNPRGERFLASGVLSCCL